MTEIGTHFPSNMPETNGPVSPSLNNNNNNNFNNNNTNDNNNILKVIMIFRQKINIKHKK